MNQDIQITTTRNISIYPEQEAVLVQFARESGLQSVSAALRFIINDWVRLKHQVKHQASDAARIRAVLDGEQSA